MATKSESTQAESWLAWHAWHARRLCRFWHRAWYHGPYLSRAILRVCSAADQHEFPRGELWPLLDDRLAAAAKLCMCLPQVLALRISFSSSPLSFSLTKRNLNLPSTFFAAASIFWSTSWAARSLFWRRRLPASSSAGWLFGDYFDSRAMFRTPTIDKPQRTFFHQKHHFYAPILLKNDFQSQRIL